jgi:hypothetical protein
LAFRFPALYFTQELQENVLSTDADHKMRMAHGGKSDISIDYVRLANGEKIALKGVKNTSGGGHTGAPETLL